MQQKIRFLPSVKHSFLHTLAERFSNAGTITERMKLHNHVLNTATIA